MNTYNENLQATVVASLQAQYLDEQNLKSQVNAAMFTLYHAEGATITAEQKLEEAKADAAFKEKVKTQAVKNTSISNNLLASATQANQYLKQSITNTSVCASNVQIAATSIVKLASDIGSMFSIVHAADFLTDTYEQTENVRDLINQTAYAAELASQWAMEASMLTSAVSSSTVADKAKNTNGLMSNLLKITSDEFSTAAQIVTGDNSTLATASTAEKIAEGVLEDISVDFKSSKAAYNSINAELNLDLTVKNITNTSFTVQFNLLKSPFPDDRTKPYADPLHFYPVSNYYIILVKDSKKSTFAITTAENFLLKNIYQCITEIQLPPATADVVFTPGKIFDFYAMPNPVPNPDPNADPNKKTYVLQDSDGDSINHGQKYVAFF